MRGGGIVIKPRCIQGQPIYSGYFELPGCGTIGQAWVRAIAPAISLTALFCFEKRNTVITPISSLMMITLMWMTEVATVKLEYISFRGSSDREHTGIHVDSIV